MDDFLDQIIMWPDTDTTGHSSWSESGTDKTNGLDADLVEVLEGTEKGIISSDIVMGSLATHGPPSNVGYILTGGNSSCGISNGIFTGETPLHQEPSCNDSVPSQHDKLHLSSQEVMESSLMAKSLGMHESMLRGKLQDFDMQAEFLRDDSKIAEKRYFGERLQQPENLPAASINLSQHLEADSMQHFTNQYFVSELQPPPSPAAAGCNGAAKPRVRARRGQATDPHSIAERLRREKIAERMKSLQELVPNSSKTDKASMLDEIIEYVKFLQLQVKVLSISRLGAAGAVVPLITDVQSEGSSSLLLSPSVGQHADLLESPDNIAVEQEVVKLMESNVTSAMQYLQTKGLCLMPLALASAISGGKASSKLFPVDRKNSITTHGVLSSKSSSPSAGTQTMSSSSESTTKDNVFRNESVEVVVNNGCNGAVVMQEEEMQKTTGNIRELKLKV